jgi:hypothetical protein
VPVLAGVLDSNDAAASLIAEVRSRRHTWRQAF